MVLKRTQRDDEDCIELRKLLTVEAEALQTAAGNMCGTVMRGAPPEFQFEPSRIVSEPGRAARSRSGGPGSVREGEEPKPDRKVGGGCIVPMKPRTTPADRLVAESVEGRVEGRARATHAPDTAPDPACPRRPEPTDRNWRAPKPRMPVASDLRQEPGAGKPHAGICAGGGR